MGLEWAQAVDRLGWGRSRWGWVRRHGIWQSRCRWAADHRGARTTQVPIPEGRGSGLHGHGQHRYTLFTKLLQALPLLTASTGTSGANQ